VTLGDLTKPVPVLMLLGFVLIAGLNYRRVLGGTLIGTLIVTTIGLPLVSRSSTASFQCHRRWRDISATRFFSHQ